MQILKLQFAKGLTNVKCEPFLRAILRLFEVAIFRKVFASKKNLFEFLAEMCNFWRTKFMLHGCQKQRYDKDFILHLCLNVGEA